VPLLLVRPVAHKTLTWVHSEHVSSPAVRVQQFVPEDGALAKLAVDYQNMVDDGLFLDDAEPFDSLLERGKHGFRPAERAIGSE
jgi:hypothetical protein